MSVEKTLNSVDEQVERMLASNDATDSYRSWRSINRQRCNNEGFLAEVDSKFENVSITCSPTPETGFFYKDAPLKVLFDNGVGIKSLVFGCYDFDPITLVASYVSESYKAEEEVLIVDLGANCGLWSRQILAMLNIDVESAAEHPDVKLLAYEADAEVAEIAQFNLQPFGEQAALIDYGVSIDGGNLVFYYDKNQPSSSSLLPLDDAYYDTCEKVIKTHSVAEFESQCNKILDNARVIFKCDIEGFDLPFFLALTEDFSRRIDFAIIESRVDDLSLESAKLANTKIAQYSKVYVWKASTMKAISGPDYITALQSYPGWDLILIR